VFVEKDPIPANAIISLDEIDPDQPLRIKFRPTGDSPVMTAKVTKVENPPALG